MKDYLINIFYNEEANGYVAVIPDLIHCPAFGATLEDALGQAMTAKQSWLDAAKKEGKAIPKPKDPPVIYQLTAMANQN